LCTGSSGLDRQERDRGSKAGKYQAHVILFDQGFVCPRRTALVSLRPELVRSREPQQHDCRNPVYVRDPRTPVMLITFCVLDKSAGAQQ
jgi:hypothetical protein